MLADLIGHVDAAGVSVKIAGIFGREGTIDRAAVSTHEIPAGRQRGEKHDNAVFIRGLVVDAGQMFFGNWGVARIYVDEGLFAFLVDQWPAGWRAQDHA